LAMTARVVLSSTTNRASAERRRQLG
jgi:hypothetical protein